MIVSIQAETGPAGPDGWAYPIATRATAEWRLRLPVPIWWARWWVTRRGSGPPVKVPAVVTRSPLALWLCYNRWHFHCWSAWSRNDAFARVSRVCVRCGWLQWRSL